VADQSIDFVVDLDKPKEEVLEKLVEALSKTDEKLKKEGQVALNFLVKKKGEKQKSFVYNLNKEGMQESEKDFVFPKVVEEVLKREFNPRIAKNEKLLNHVMEELKKDPYWSDRVVKLIKTLKDK
jgi:hypothetical protein